jgi:hypothetical protein
MTIFLELEYWWWFSIFVNILKTTKLCILRNEFYGMWIMYQLNKSFLLRYLPGLFLYLSQSFAQMSFSQWIRSSSYYPIFLGPSYPVVPFKLHRCIHFQHNIYFTYYGYCYFSPLKYKLHEFMDFCLLGHLCIISVENTSINIG